MTTLVFRTLLRSPRRLLIGLVGVAVPVALFAATAFFVDTSSKKMTTQAVAPVQIDMQVLASSPTVDLRAITPKLASIPGIQAAEPFASATVPALIPGSATPRDIKVFAIQPSYLQRYPWVHVSSGSFAAGALLADPLASASTPPGSTLTFQLPGGASVPVTIGGSVDLRKADSWFALTSGNNQGEVRFVPDSVVIDYSTFRTSMLPALAAAASASASSASNGSGASAPAASVSLEEHLVVDHSTLAADPATALVRTTALRRTLERAAPGQITAVDNLGDALNAAKGDALNAKVLFLFLGIPGVLVAAGLAVATAAALAAAQRRELALLRLRGATDAQINRLSRASSLTIGGLGSILGLALAALGVSVLLGSSAWKDTSSSSLTLSIVLALGVGMAVTATSLRAGGRAARRATVTEQHTQLDPVRVPAWKRLRLDLAAIGVGVAILAINAWSGGFAPTPSEGQTLSLSFYLLLAPLALWVGVTLLALRGVTAWLHRATRPERARPLGTWPGAAMRWMGRRPGRSISTAIIAVLAVAFGTNLLAFVATYDTAKHTEAAANVGADIRVVPAQVTPAPTPPLSSPDIAASTPVRVITLTAGTDKRPAYAVEAKTFASVIGRSASKADGGASGLAALAGDPSAVLISTGFAKDFNVAVGDPVNVSLPDATGASRSVTLHAVGTYASVVPAVPGADLIVNVGAYALPRAFPVAPANPLPTIPAPTTSIPATPTPSPAARSTPPNPDFYLANVASGRSVAAVAQALRDASGTKATWTVSTLGDAVIKEQSTLATLNLSGLSRIETTGTVLIAALGVAVLGAFLVLERRREYAVMRSLGATTRQVLVPPALEVGSTILVGIALGVPIGLGMTTITTRVLTPLFTISPPLATIPGGRLALLAALVAAVGALSLGGALGVVAKLRTVAVLRET